MRSLPPNAMEGIARAVGSCTAIRAKLIEAAGHLTNQEPGRADEAAQLAYDEVDRLYDQVEATLERLELERRGGEAPAETAARTSSGLPAAANH